MVHGIGGVPACSGRAVPWLTQKALAGRRAGRLSLAWERLLRGPPTRRASRDRVAARRPVGSHSKCIRYPQNTLKTPRLRMSAGRRGARGGPARAQAVPAERQPRPRDVRERHRRRPHARVRRARTRLSEQHDMSAFSGPSCNCTHPGVPAHLPHPQHPPVCAMCTPQGKGAVHRHAAARRFTHACAQTSQRR